MFVASLVLALVAPSPRLAGAQNNTTRSIAQQQADAVQRMVVLGVEQNLGLLPPAAGQPYSYRFDPAVGMFERDEVLGPFWFQAPSTLGEQRLDFRTSFSYFELDGSFGNVNYTFVDPPGGTPCCLETIGLRANAKVFATNLSLSYGLLSWVDVFANVPIVVVDPSATQTYMTEPGSENQYIGSVFDPSRTPDEIVQEDLRTGRRVLLQAPLSELGATFDSGTTVGLGRIALGSKLDLASILPASWSEYVNVGSAMTLSIPSPDEAQFAGSDSFALFPRLIVASSGAKARARLFADVGYQYDFSFNELSRFAWSVGSSIFLASSAVLDLGFSGSLYSAEVEWTPSTGNAAATPPANGQRGFPATSYFALSDTGIGKNLVDLLIGARVGILDDLTLSGGVSVPITNDGFRPAAAGTIALEYAFGGPR